MENENLVVVSPNWQRRDSVSLEGRRSLFDFGGIDLTPMVVILLIIIIKDYLLPGAYVSLAGA